MNDHGPEFSFHGLPLSAEQESEIQHYIHQRQRRGLPLDVEELRKMLRDMLDPPADDSVVGSTEVEGVHADVERAAGLVEDEVDPITAREERMAAREAEAMKHSE